MTSGWPDSPTPPADEGTDGRRTSRTWSLMIVLRLAIGDIRRATGFEFTYAGHTVERPNPSRRTGPILVTFTDAAESPTMTEKITGRGGSSYTAYHGERAWYSTGQVMLSADYFARLSRGNDTARMRAVVDHELAHVAGLDHVDDTEELMHPSGQRLQFGRGDLTGLAILGRQPC